jgi:hypothetical protein
MDMPLNPSGYLCGIRVLFDNLPTTLPAWMYDEDLEVEPDPDAPFAVMPEIRLQLQNHAGQVGERPLDSPAVQVGARPYHTQRPAPFTFAAAQQVNLVQHP